MTDCEKVLAILKDGKLHRNFDIIDMFGSGFALAARIKDLKNQGWKIESGSPLKFNLERIHQGDWYYQLESVTKCNGLEQFSPEPEPAYSCAENGQMEIKLI